jgi:glycosyltransferase involved in cell wall biosynthesis
MNILKKDYGATDCQLLIAGEGDQMPELKLLAKELKIQDHVSWLGKVPNQELSQYYQTSVSSIVPSLWQEACPTVVLEAMINKLPVIGSRVGGIPDQIDDGKTGFMFPVHDHVALAKILKKMYNNQKLSSKMGQSAYQKAQKQFSRQVYYQKLMKIYESVLNN